METAFGGGLQCLLETRSALCVPEDRDASLVHLYPALWADELLEEAPYLLLGTCLTVELPTAGTLPCDPSPEAAYLPVALDTVASDQGIMKS